MPGSWPARSRIVPSRSWWPHACCESGSARYDCGHDKARISIGDVTLEGTVEFSSDDMSAWRAEVWTPGADRSKLKRSAKNYLFGMGNVAPRPQSQM